MSTAPVIPNVIRLGIPGLASLTDSLMRGAAYAVVAEAPPARYPLIASSLGSALKQGLPCTVILPGQPEAFIERINSFHQFDLKAALARGQLQFFVLQENFTKTMFRFGAQVFCRELDHFEIPPDSFLIFEQADDLLSLHDVSLAMGQIEVLRHWFGERHVTAMLVFSRIAGSIGAMAALQCLMDQLAGIVRIGGHRDGLEMTFDYWQSPEGTVAAKSYPLESLESGLLAVAKPMHAERNGSGNGDDNEYDVADEGEDHVFFMDPDLISLGKQMPGIWQHVDSLVGMMHATRGIRSATVILSFRRDTDLRQLAQTVHTLRHGLGRRARIVVQEKDASLRYQNEALLLRLGLNLVIHLDVPASRMPLLLASLGGQIFDRDVDINFDAALASVIPSGLRGYLLPERFVSEASALVERAATLDIPCAMVVGQPARDTGAADILARIRMARSGDLITFDHQYGYLFLSGCPEANLLMTLERVLGQDVGASFAESRFIVRRHEILAELAALSRAAQRHVLPDYSTVQARQPTPPVASAPAIASPAPAPAKAPIHILAPRPLLATSRVPAPAVQAVELEIVANSPHEAMTEAAAPPAAAVLEMAESGGRFQYSGDLSQPATFGKKEAPRATRAAPAKKS
jgi:cellulose biosynthesis protein BcsE